MSDYEPDPILEPHKKWLRESRQNYVANAIELLQRNQLWIEKELAAMRVERNELRRLAAFLRCSVKSGEPWTDTCEKTYNAAMKGE